jgi:hypothetical protein
MDPRHDEQGKSPAKLSRPAQFNLYEEIRAFEESGKGVRESVRIAASAHGLDAETTRAWYKRWKKNDGRRHGNLLFSAQEEEELVGLLEGFSLLGRPLPRPVFLQEVKRLRPAQDSWDPADWYSGFLQRHKSRLMPKALKGLEFDRVDERVEAQVKEFVDWFPAWFNGKGLSTRVLVNADETRVRIEGGQFRAKGIESTSKPKGGAVEATEGKAATYTPFHTADGKIVMAVFTLPLDTNGNSNFLLRRVERPSRDSHPTYFCFTETGWMDAVTWLAVLGKFKEVMDCQFPGLHPCLILDKLSVHMEDENLRFCLSNNINCVFFPAHATHFLQPSDNVLFTLFKKLLYSKLQVQLLTLRPDIRDLGGILVGIAQDLEDCLTPELIRASWRNTGMNPWDPDKIRQHAQINAGRRQENAANDTQVAATARQITQSIIQRDLGDNKKKRIRVQGPKQKLFSGEEILRLQDKEEELRLEEVKVKEEKRAKKRQAKEDAASAREAHVCRGSSHKNEPAPVWKGSGAWLWCETCDSYGVCPKCKRADASALEEHEENCEKKK